VSAVDLDDTSETWRAVVGHESIYEVSDAGRVRSCTRSIVYRNGRIRHYPGQVLQPWLNHDGYPCVSLKSGGKRLTRRVHILVAAAFLGERPRGMETCHGDGDRTNADLSNLRYDTPSGNRLDSVKHGTHVNASRETCPRGHALISPNLVPSLLSTGRRGCRACARARSDANYAAARGRTVNASTRADWHYDRLMGSGEAAS
jgi:hypothetical protein